MPSRPSYRWLLEALLWTAAPMTFLIAILSWAANSSMAASIYGWLSSISLAISLAAQVFGVRRLSILRSQQSSWMARVFLFLCSACSWLVMLFLTVFLAMTGFYLFNPGAGPLFGGR